MEESWFKSTYDGVGNLAPLQYSSGDQLGAQFKLENIIGSSMVSMQGIAPVDPNFSPMEFLEHNYGEDEDEEQQRIWSLIAESTSAIDANRKINVDNEFKRAQAIRQTMGTWDSLWTGAIAGITDPIVLATTAVPILRAGLTVGGAAGRLGALAVAEQSAIEGVLHSQQTDRTLTESALNIGANAILGGVLGGVGSRFYNSSRAYSTADGSLEQQSLVRGVLTAEGDTYIGGFKAPKSRAELEVALQETDLVGRGFFNGIGATALNPTARVAAQQGSVEARVIMQELNGHDFLTGANLTGKTGTAATDSVSTAVERTSGRFAGANLRALQVGYKDYVKENGRNLVKGWDDFLNDVGVHYRAYDPDLPELTPQWARKLIPDLEKINKGYEEHLIRIGAFDDVLIPAGKLKAKLMKAEDSYKAAKNKSTKARHQDDIDDLTEQLSLMERHNAGDLDATRKLISELHGEKRYLTQSHNVELLRENRFDWLATMAVAERKWHDTRLTTLGGDKTARGRVFKRKMDKMFKVRVAKDGTVIDEQSVRLNAIYDELRTSRDSFNLGGMNTVASQGKARQLRIDQTVAAPYLKGNYMDLQNAHYSAVLPNVEMRNRGLLPDSKEFNARTAQIRKEIDMMQEGATPKRIKELERIYDKIVKDITNVQDIIQHRNYKNVTQLQRDIGFAITQFNATRQLGAMLIPSFGDVAGTVSKTGLKNIARAIKPFSQRVRGLNLEAKEASELVGIIELVSASRMHALNNSAELGINQGTTARMMGRVSQTFYKATGILWWNQGMKEIAIIGWGDRMLKAAARPSKMSKADKMWLARDGWDEAKLAQLADLHRRYPTKQDSTDMLNTGSIYEDWNSSTVTERSARDADVRLADEYNATLLKHAERAVVTPGAGDFPSFITGHPFLKLLGQYKGFGAASINKTTIPMAQGMIAGDANMAFGFMGLTTLGATAYMLRQTMYDREISENPQTLAYEGLLRGGALGLYSDGMAISQKMTQNWFGLGDQLGIETPSRYYARGLLTDVLGPTAGLAEDAGYMIHAASGLARGEQLSESDKAKGARMLPFNNLFYLRAVLENY
jgi:hypothetical protein